MWSHSGSAVIGHVLRYAGRGNEGDAMKVAKAHILELLRERGDEDQVIKAQHQLPDEVDTDHHAGLLREHGISVKDLADKLGGELPNVL
jgi:hypothetical protein